MALLYQPTQVESVAFANSGYISFRDVWMLTGVAGSGIVRGQTSGEPLPRSTVRRCRRRTAPDSPNALVLRRAHDRSRSPDGSSFAYEFQAWALSYPSSGGR